ATSTLAAGAHTITATYAGSGTWVTSKATLTQTVTNTTTALASSLHPAKTGQSVTFTATVTAVAPATGTPTGNVAFKDGATTLATVALNASGKATFTTSTLAAGTHTITATY